MARGFGTYISNYLYDNVIEFIAKIFIHSGFGLFLIYRNNKRIYNISKLYIIVEINVPYGARVRCRSLSSILLLNSFMEAARAPFCTLISTVVYSIDIYSIRKSLRYFNSSPNFELTQTITQYIDITIISLI